MEYNKLDNYMERANIIANYYKANPESLTPVNMEYLVELRDDCLDLMRLEGLEGNIGLKNYEVFGKLNGILRLK